MGLVGWVLEWVWETTQLQIRNRLQLLHDDVGGFRRSIDRSRWCVISKKVKHGEIQIVFFDVRTAGRHLFAFLFFSFQFQLSNKIFKKRFLRFSLHLLLLLSLKNNNQLVDHLGNGCFCLAAAHSSLSCKTK